MKQLICRLTAGLAAAAGAVTLCALPASAAVERTLVGYIGDVTADLTVNADDVRLLSSHLRTGDVIADTAAYADLNGDQEINAVDLTLLKQLILSGAEPEGVYIETEVPDPEPELISAPINILEPTLPATGETRILMFAVQFPDVQFTEGLSTEQIWAQTFGPEDTASSAYPLESISAYYTRASYGRLHMSGDVYQYTAKKNLDSYVGDTDGLLDEIMDAMDSEIDYTKYDVNANGTMDTVLVALPSGASGRDVNYDGTEDWWPCSGGYYGRKKFDGIRAGNLCIGAWALSDVTGFNSTWVHELGHAMGLPDYYKYENTQNGYYGLNGDAGTEMMDDAMGDMCAFSKLMYGWYTTAEVQTYTGGTQTFTLQSSQQAPGCIIIPRTSGSTDYYNEFFVLEYATPEGNNAHSFYENRPYTIFRNGGLRVLHCDAELWNGYWGLELKWNNYGQMYDSSNEKQRVLRLVNEAEGGGFFGAGSTVTTSYQGFRWYDDSGSMTVDPHISITVDSIADGVLTVTISEA